MIFITAENKQEIIDMIDRIVQTRKGEVSQYDFDGLKSQLIEDLQALQTTVNALPTESQLNSKANQEDLSSLQDIVSKDHDAITAFGITPEQVETINALLQAIAADAPESQVSDLIVKINTTINDLQALKLEVEDSQSGLATKAQQSDLDSLTQTVDSKANQTDLAALTTKVNDPTSGLAALNGNLNNLKPHYPNLNLNLLSGTRDFSGTNWTNFNAWTTDPSIVPPQAGLAVKHRGVSQLGNGIYQKFIAPTDGTYTFSAWIRTSIQNDTTINAIHSYYQTIISGVTGSLSTDFANLSQNVWSRYTRTFSNLKAGDSFFVRFEITNSTSAGDLWIAGCKVEQGTAATPWMPSILEVTPNDYTSYIIPLNYTHIAYSYSADGSDRFTKTYPNMNLLTGTRGYNKTVTITSSVSNLNLGDAAYFDMSKLVTGTVYQMTISFDWKINWNSITPPSSGWIGFEIWNGSWSSFRGWIDSLDSITSGHAIYSQNVTLSDAKSKLFFISNTIPPGVQFTVTNLKLELGSVATSWMPSASEATIDDYPSYVGFLSDNNQTASTNYADYSWMRIK